MFIVMTGATDGIGLFAARDLLARGHDLRVGSRTPDKAARVLRAVPAGGRVAFEPLDLGDLASVRAFAGRVLAGPPIDRLVLNAGLQQIRPTRSAQGLDLTFAANHLAHWLLVDLLTRHMAPDGRIILTASGTHDPDQKTGMPPPRHADARLLAYPELDSELDADPGKAGRRAYSASKLCNVMTARELARRLAESRPDLAVIAFDPGFSPGTGLARSYPPPLGLVFRYILPLVVRGDRISTPAVSGRLLAALAAEPAYADSRGAYWAVNRRRLIEEPPSALARDDDACRRLWEDSAALAG